MVGGEASEGAAGRTTAVGAESADPEPPALVAVSCTLSVLPTSPAVGTYVPPVAPVIFAQLLPEESHSSHWSLTCVGLFVQVASLTVSVCPCWAVPLIVGRLPLEGGSGRTTAVGAEAAGALDPLPLVAVSSTTIVLPTSLVASV